MLQTSVNDYQLNYTEDGNGECLIFVHGSASDYRTWDHQVSAFGKHYRAISYSRRFHFPNEKISDKDDYSMMQHVDDLELFIKFITDKPVHLVGHSYGAFICLLLAIKNPRLVRTLVLAEPPVVTLFVSNIPKPLELIRLLFSKPKLASAIIEFGVKGVEPAKAAFRQDNMNKALDIFGKATLGVNTYRNLSTARHQQAFDNLIKAELLGTGFPPLDKEKIQNMTLPILLITGQNSRKLFHYLMDGLQDLLPHAKRIIIPDASHIMHEDNPTNYDSSVLSFLKLH